MIITKLKDNFFHQVDLTRQRDPIENPDFKKLQLSDLKNYLDQEESKVPHVSKEIQKHIVWADSQNPQMTPFALAYIHGFTATHHECEPLPTWVAQELGANRYYTRLSGHAHHPNDMAHVQAVDWLNDALETLRIAQKIGQKVILMGLSTGSALAAWLASQHPEAVHTLILLSPNFKIKSPISHLFKIKGSLQLAQSVSGPYRKKKLVGGVPPPFRHLWVQDHRWEGVQQLVLMVEHFSHIKYQDIPVPLFVAYSENDQVVSPQAIKKVYAAWGSQVGLSNKALYHVEHIDQHVVAGDMTAPQTNKILLDQIMSFLTLSSAR